jgi:hypothetical protein
MHDGLLLRKLRAHLSGIRRVHAGLLERPMFDLLRRRSLQRGLFEWALQYLLPRRSDLHGRLLGGRVRPRVCAGIDLLVHELSRWVVHVHGCRLQVGGSPTHGPEVLGAAPHLNGAVRKCSWAAAVYAPRSPCAKAQILRPQSEDGHPPAWIAGA